MAKHKTLPLGIVVQDRPIDALDQLYSRLTLRKHTITVGDGTKRARAAAAAHRTQQKQRLQDAEPPIVTRQQRRRSAVLRERQLVTVAKKEIRARRLHVPGGSATLRTADDVARILGD